VTAPRTIARVLARFRRATAPPASTLEQIGDQIAEQFFPDLPYRQAHANEFARQLAADATQEVPLPAVDDYIHPIGQHVTDVESEPGSYIGRHRVRELTEYAIQMLTRISDEADDRLTRISAVS